jgi:hypothetical protein
LTNNNDARRAASVFHDACGGDCVSRANQEENAEKLFWQEVNALLIQLVCLVERHKLASTYTTSDLRKAGKSALCTDRRD